MEELTKQEKQDKYLLQLIPIKNIQRSYLGCHIVVFEKTPQEVINILKNKGFYDYKNGIYHTLTNEGMCFLITNRRKVYFHLQVNPYLIEYLNLKKFYRHFQLLKGEHNENTRTN